MKGALAIRCFGYGQALGPGAAGECGAFCRLWLKIHAQIKIAGTT